MSPVAIVIVDEPRIRCLPGLLTVISSHIGPLLHQRAIKPLDLAIGLRTIRPGELMDDTLTKRVSKHMRTVATPVISHHLFDGEPAPSEKGPRPLPEPGSSIFPLVSQDLRVHQP